MLCQPASVAPAFLYGNRCVKGRAAGEFVQDALADVRIQIAGSEFFALLAEFRDPRFVLRAKLLFEFLANALRQCGTLAAGRDRDLQVSTSNYSGVIEIAICRIIDCVAENPSGVRFGKYARVHIARRGSDDDEELPLQIGGFELTLMPIDRSSGSPLANLRRGLRSDDLYRGALDEQPLNLALSDNSGADYQARPRLEF
jgi:hypothetical protein